MGEAMARKYAAPQSTLLVEPTGGRYPSIDSVVVPVGAAAGARLRQSGAGALVIANGKLRR